MRGASGAVDHVRQENGTVLFHTVDDAPAIGLCGSGLLDLVAVLLELNIIDESGRLTCGERYTLPGTDVFLTQKDIREVQLAKAAIRAGIELLCSPSGRPVPGYSAGLTRRRIRKLSCPGIRLPHRNDPGTAA